MFSISTKCGWVNEILNDLYEQLNVDWVSEDLLDKLSEAMEMVDNIREEANGQQ